MGMLAMELPMIDTIGSNVTFISGTMYERLGSLILAVRYLDTTMQGTSTREIVRKDVMTLEAVMANDQKAQAFLRQITENPIRRFDSH